MNHVNRAFLGLLLFFAILLSACGPSSSVTTANTLAAIYTEAAGTVAAQESTGTQPLFDQSVALTPAGTPLDTPSPTELPTLVSDLPTSTPGTTTLSESGCNAIYVADATIPDGTVMSPGQTFVKTWTLQNNGSCTWDTGFTIRFFSGDQMGGASGPVSSSVAPGGQADVSVSLTAPLTAGTYTGNWRMADDSGSSFGEIVDVKIEVDQSVTETPELTDTPIIDTVTPAIMTATTAPTSAPTTAPTSAPTSAPTTVPTTAVLPTSVPTTAVPPTSVPTTAVPPTSVPTTAVPPTSVPTTAVPPTSTPH